MAIALFYLLIIPFHREVVKEKEISPSLQVISDRR